MVVFQGESLLVEKPPKGVAVENQRSGQALLIQAAACNTIAPSRSRSLPKQRFE